jgi:tryptophan synthase alpha chain
MALEKLLRERRQHKDLLLMTHIVLGYPSFETSRDLVLEMVDAGADAIELQIPFSEPMADGPVIVKASHDALAAGSTVARCFDFFAEMAPKVPVPLLFMTYYNLVFSQGVAKFVARARASGAVGGIVPDLPIEEAEEYLQAMRHERLDPVLLVAPNTPVSRISVLAERASGMLYCVARKGITGAQTEFSGGLAETLARVRAATALPLGVGFGVREPADVAFLRGKADVAIVGSETIRVLERSGVAGVGQFLRTLMSRS